VLPKIKFKKYLFFKKSTHAARCWWLTPVILAIHEAEIKRTMVRSQPGQIVLDTLS
jgi:hypothetical protein